MEAAESHLDALWSTQYLVPGALFAFAGPVRSIDRTPYPQDSASYTHGMHLRFNNVKVCVTAAKNKPLHLQLSSPVICMALLTDIHLLQS